MTITTADPVPVYAAYASTPELARQRVILASVPGRLRDSGEQDSGERGQPGGVVVVSGLRPGWPAQVRTAVADGAQGVFVAQPGSAGRDDLQAAVDRAADAGVPVAVGLRFAANRSWSAAVPAVRADIAGSALADCVVVAAPAPGGSRAVLVNALTEQLCLLRQLCDPVSDLTVLAAARDHYVVAAAGVPVITLTGIVSALPEPRLSLDLAGVDQRWSVVIPGGSPAAPASISRYRDDAVQVRPVLHESGERAVWVQLHAAITAGAPLEASLAASAHAIAAATEAMQTAG
jgi:hypothetical protein